MRPVRVERAMSVSEYRLGTLIVCTRCHTGIEVGHMGEGMDWIVAHGPRCVGQALSISTPRMSMPTVPPKEPGAASPKPGGIR